VYIFRFTKWWCSSDSVPAYLVSLLWPFQIKSSLHLHSDWIQFRWMLKSLGEGNVIIQKGCMWLIPSSIPQPYMANCNLPIWLTHFFTPITSASTWTNLIRSPWRWRQHGRLRSWNKLVILQHTITHKNITWGKINVTYTLTHKTMENTNKCTLDFMLFYASSLLPILALLGHPQGDSLIGVKQHKIESIKTWSTFAGVFHCFMS
jgi:hypothetical protein